MSEQIQQQLIEKKKRVPRQKKDKKVEEQKMKIDEEVKVDDPQPHAMNHVEEQVEVKVEEQKMKIEEEVKVDDPQAHAMNQVEEVVENVVEEHVEEHVEEEDEKGIEEEEQAGEEMVDLYRIKIGDTKVKFLDVNHFMASIQKLHLEKKSFEVKYDSISKNDPLYKSLLIQETAKKASESGKIDKSQKQKKSQSAPKEKIELVDNLQVRHVWKGETWQATINRGIIINDDNGDNYKTFSEFGRKHKLSMGQDTTSNGVAECEWFNIDTQKWVKGMYA